MKYDPVWVERCDLLRKDEVYSTEELLTECIMHEWVIRSLKCVGRLDNSVWFPSQHFMWWTPTSTGQRADPCGLSDPHSPAGPFWGSHPTSHFCLSGKEDKQTNKKNGSVLLLLCSDLNHSLSWRPVSALTSLSSSIIFFSCWWSCLFFISSTTLRLSSSCSRYRVWESFCRDKCQNVEGSFKTSITSTASPYYTSCSHKSKTTKQKGPCATYIVFWAHTASHTWITCKL